MGSLLTVLVVSITSVGAIVFGIFATYATVTGILYAFAQQSGQRSNRTLVLVASESHAGGD
ncbi:MAG: hypothetical protein NVS1B11_18830 [Terriglobales bacterium]